VGSHRPIPVLQLPGSGRDYPSGGVFVVASSGFRGGADVEDAYTLWASDYDGRQAGPDGSDAAASQVRYDDPASLSVKYKMASEHGLRGVGVWHLDTLDYASQDPRVRSQTEAMWDAISVFTEAKKGSAPALIG